MNSLLTRLSFRHGARLLAQLPLISVNQAKYSRQNDFFTNQTPQKSTDSLEDSLAGQPLMELDMSVTNSIETIIEPTLESLGLCASTPAGLVQRIMEFLHITGDLPWWGVIATSALVARISLLPIVIKNRKAMVQYINTMSDVQEMTKEVSAAKENGDYEKMTRLAMERQKALTKIPFKDMFVMPLLVQGGTLMSMLIGLRGMASLPVESMKTGGLAWFQDLTMADPYFVLPLVCSVSYLIVIETGAESGGQEVNHLMKKVLRVIAPVIFICTMKFQSALTLYFSVNSMITLVQAQVLRNPKIKQMCGIREIRRNVSFNDPSNNKSFHDGFKEAMETAQIIDEMKERERLRELQEKIEKIKRKQTKK